jgi:hypothetical protein
MLGKAVAIAAALAASLGPEAAGAQDADSEAAPTAEQMIEVARETWGSPNLDPRCPEAQPGEIVVCRPEEEDFSVESPTDEAIRTGQPMPDGLPRAPNVFGLPPCKAYAFCSRVGRTPEPPLLIDLAALPHPLTPEEAALVFRAEDLPQQTATPEAASPAAAP